MLLTTKKIIKNVITINSFFKDKLKKKPKFAVTGLNPHCETNKNFSEEEKIIFAPDKYLGAYLQKKLNRKLRLWDGSCQVHIIFSEKELIKLATLYSKLIDRVVMCLLSFCVLRKGVPSVLPVLLVG